jgi:hypothetical protein
MKHFGIKVLLFVAIGLCALPRTYAQDTTITIYGKRFAPGVIVKINGVRIDSVSIRHDNTQPSRILYVTFPLSMLQKPATAVAEAKGAGATLTSDGVENTVSVGNPGNPEATYTTFPLYVKTALPKLLFTTRTQEDSLSRVRISVPLGTTGDTVLRVRYSNIPIGTDIRLQIPGLDSLQFGVYDSTGTQRIWSFRTTARQSSFAFMVRYVAPSNLPALSAMITPGNLNVSANISGKSIAQTLRLEAVPVQIIQVLAAYTENSTKKFYDTIPNPGNPFAPEEGKEKSLPAPSQFFQSCLTLLNSYLGTLDQSSGKLAQTRFKFIEAPFQVIYTEKASSLTFNETQGALHSDIDALQGDDLLEQPNGRSQISEISQRQASINYNVKTIILLLTNSESTPYRAIGSSCSDGSLPKYLIVEAKYATTFINENFLDKNMITALQQAIQ